MIIRRLIGRFFAVFLAFVGLWGVPAHAVTCPSGEIDIDGTCVNGKFAIKTTNLSANTQYKFTMAAAGTFTVDCGEGGTLSGTGVSGNTIDRTSNTTMATYTCTYSTGGVKTVVFDGVATGYYTSFNSANPCNSEAICFGNYMYTSYATPTLIESVYGSLSALFPYFGSSNGQFTRFDSLFEGASNLTSVSDPLFSGYTTAADHMFARMFHGCSKLTSVSDGFFDGITFATTNSFRDTFGGCTSLTTLPDGLFADVTTVTGTDTFNWMCAGCSSLTRIPERMFAGITTVTSNLFANVFYGCTSLTGYIPPSTFAALTAAGAPTASQMFNNTFYNTQLATSCPCGMKQFLTGYEGSSTTTTQLGGRVSCEPDLTVDLSTCKSCEAGTTQVLNPSTGEITCEASSSTPTVYNITYTMRMMVQIMKTPRQLMKKALV